MSRWHLIASDVFEREMCDKTVKSNEYFIKYKSTCDTKTNTYSLKISESYAGAPYFLAKNINPGK